MKKEKEKSTNLMILIELFIRSVLPFSCLAALQWRWYHQATHLSLCSEVRTKGPPCSAGELIGVYPARFQPKCLLSPFCFSFEPGFSIIIAFIYLLIFFLQSTLLLFSMPALVAYHQAIKNRLFKSCWQNPRGCIWTYLL